MPHRRPLPDATAFPVRAAALPSAARAQAARDDTLARKVVRIAVATDFPPRGFVGTDLEPQALDVDMAHLIGAKLGVAVEQVPVTNADRIPYRQTKKSVKGAADLASKSAGTTRCAIEDLGPTRIAPPGADIGRFEDNPGPVAAFASGQVQVVATGA